MVASALNRQALGIPALLAGLALASLSNEAAGQDRTGNDARAYDYTIAGVQYRVPARYMKPSVDPNYRVEHLAFPFWLSDGMPQGENVPPIGTRERHGRGLYWPPVPGRPSFSDQDFLVFVAHAAPTSESQGLKRQAWPRESAVPLPTVNEHGLHCRNFPTRAKSCFTAAGEDPDVAMDRQDWGSGNFDWVMRFYSKPDSLWARLYIPDLGQPRWSEIVCRTLQLVRSWRTSPGPQPPDCVKSRHVLLWRIRDLAPAHVHDSRGKTDFATYSNPTGDLAKMWPPRKPAGL